MIHYPFYPGLRPANLCFTLGLGQQTHSQSISSWFSPGVLIHLLNQTKNKTKNPLHYRKNTPSSTSPALCYLLYPFFEQNKNKSPFVSGSLPTTFRLRPCAETPHPLVKSYNLPTIHETRVQSEKKNRLSSSFSRLNICSFRILGLMLINPCIMYRPQWFWLTMDWTGLKWTTADSLGFLDDLDTVGLFYLHQQTTELLGRTVHHITACDSCDSATDRSPPVQLCHSAVQNPCPVQHCHKALTVLHNTIQHYSYMKIFQFIFFSSPFTCRYSGSCVVNNVIFIATLQNVMYWRANKMMADGVGTRVVVLELMWGWETSSWARIDVVDVGDERSGSSWHGGGGTWATRLERTWWRCDMSGCTQVDKMEAGDEHSSSNWHDGGGRRAVRLELMWWMHEMSVLAQIDMVGVADKWSGLRVCSGGGTRAVALELMQCGWQMSSWAQIDVVDAWDECSGSNWHGGGGRRVIGLESM